MKKIYVIAGEASGDLHGAKLIQALREISKTPLVIYGVGGDKIKETGALNFFDLAHFHVTGITQAISRFPQYKKASKIILNQVKDAKPDVVVLIDNPGFNLHLAQKIHSFGIPIVYYIAPQLWAWAPKRILKIKKYISKVLVVFDFEKKLYEKENIPVAFVGHPLKDFLISEIKKASKPHPKDKTVITLLPGSRKGEVKTLLPIFVKSVKIIAQSLPKASFNLIKAPTLPLSFYNRLLGSEAGRIKLIQKDSYEAIGSSDLAIVCSGTATLECALLGVPMIITNKGSFLTYIAAKNLIRVPYLGLPNIILGEKRFPELLQYDATAKKIASHTLKILESSSIKDSMKSALDEVSKKLGEPGAAKRAAEEIFELNYKLSL